MRSVEKGDLFSEETGSGSINAYTKSYGVKYLPEKLVCDRCGVTYTDKASIQMSKTMANSWKAQCREDSVEARGLAPCPNINCKGELILQA